MIHADWLRPGWDVDGAGGVMTTRAGGVSEGPYASMNLGDAVGDDPHAVRENRARLAQAIGARPVWLKQVHGAVVADLDRWDGGPGPIEADASVTTRTDVACVIGVADCLPVLFAAPGGRAVAAAHAGWRGLAGGVLENTVLAVCAAAGCGPAELRAWLGVGIGPAAFEVGVEVLQAFGMPPEAPDPLRFKPQAAADGSPRWRADLPLLARDRLAAAGLQEVGGADGCTVSMPSRFFSFRRDRVTGRMAAAVWRTR